MKRAAVTIDVDSLRFYAQIHGLPEIRGDDPIYTLALPRFARLIAGAGIHATVFAVGEDAARYPEAFRFVAETGSELASHSYSHDYRLSQRSSKEIENDLEKAEDALSPLCGPPPRNEKTPAGPTIRGFRAPGYNVSSTLLSVLLRRGYLYDSSLLPAPAYWMARAVALGRYALLRRPSVSLLGHFSAFAGPLEPYRTTPEKPWKPTPDGPLLELPMAVSSWARLPLFGTSWILWPTLLRHRLLDGALDRLPLINFEMHAIDLLGPDDPGVPKALIRAQPDLRISANQKLVLFSRLFSTLAHRTEVRSLADWSRTFCL